MTTIVVSTTTVCKPGCVDPGIQPRHAWAVDTLLSRILWLVEHRADNNQARLNAQSGLGKNHVSTTITRLRKNPSSKIESDTLIAIARGGRVPIEWLAKGVGEPIDLGIGEQQEIRVAYTERYPGRAEAAKILDGIIRKDAIQETLQWGLSASEDPGVEWWAEQMKRVARLKDQREKTPGAAEKERARHVAEGDELEAQADAHLAAAPAPPASNDAPPVAANNGARKGDRGKR